ncbi:MAG: type II toxin-antitoxin system RelE/ParE family toxin [Deltaproteobacteria bacterium]|nr:type II toxin-antitoxin system RelE/ParE family toxin [Deltaproteobacteria bacterium]
MPIVEVIFFKDEKRQCPVLEWLNTLPQKIEAKARARIEELAKLGHELRRPLADYLRDNIYELRWRYHSVNYRILYFFYQRTTVVLSHGFTKEHIVPPKEIEVAIKNKKLFESNPEKYSYETASYEN